MPALSTPKRVSVKTRENGEPYLRWNPVDWATAYEVTVGEETPVVVDKNEFEIKDLAAGSYAIKVVAKGDEDAFVGSKAAEFTYEAVSVTVEDGDEVLKTQIVKSGETPAPPAVADKDFAPSHTMVFKGWDKEVVGITEDTVYTAVFEKRMMRYEITFVYGSEGEKSEKATLDYGAAPVAPTVNDEVFAPSHTMVFTGWDREITAVSADAVYTAQYEKRMTSYLITFVYGIDGEYSEEFTLEYGQTPEPPAVPDVIMSKTLVNVFDGWDTAVVPVG